MIKAQVVADSKNTFGNRATTMVVTFPRFILAELNTHRMFSRNSASSRAIPYKKMLRSVMENPFIPIAWQKDHSGMQGTEYLNPETKCDINQFLIALQHVFNREEDKELLDAYVKVLDNHRPHEYTLQEWWLKARDLVVEASVILSCFGVTKQLCNRLLEPFMWHTVLVTATEWENFFYLRCPKYAIFNENVPMEFRSWKDLNAFTNKIEAPEFVGCNDNMSIIDRLMCNKGQAEIHMMALAEAMWDARQESTPKQLRAGEWHIPFGDIISLEKISMECGFKDTDRETGSDPDWHNKRKIEIATAMCARVSYTVVGEEGKEPNYENDINLHDRLAKGHWSPFEHCARVMTESEIMHLFVKSDGIEIDKDNPDYLKVNKELGWSGNFRGFIQYRKMFHNENITV